MADNNNIDFDVRQMDTELEFNAFHRKRIGHGYSNTEIRIQNNFFVLLACRRKLAVKVAIASVKHPRL